MRTRGGSTAATELVRARRYENGECPECGCRLDDATLAEGYAYCAGDVCADFLV